MAVIQNRDFIPQYEVSTRLLTKKNGTLTISKKFRTRRNLENIRSKVFHLVREKSMTYIWVKNNKSNSLHHSRANLTNTSIGSSSRKPENHQIRKGNQSKTISLDAWIKRIS